MNAPRSTKPATAATVNGLQDVDQLGSSINQECKSTRRINQRPPSGRRAAYLERQKRVAERVAQKIGTQQSAQADHRVPARTKAPSEPESLNTAGANRAQLQRFTPEQRRRMDQLGVEIDRVTQADRKFFERFPHRNHLVRLATRAEIEQLAIIHCHDQTLPGGFRHYVAVRNVAPGLRVRISIIGCEGNDTDLPETEARLIFEAHAGTKAHELEKVMRRAADQKMERL